MRTTSATFQADKRLAQHLPGLGFDETTGSAYHWACGWRSFYHLARWLSVWLHPGHIRVQAGTHWRFVVNGSVQAETLDYLLATADSAQKHLETVVATDP